MKRWLVAMVTLVMVLGAAVPAALADTTSITVDGKVITTDVAPTSINGVLMVPLRAVVDAVGGQVFWNDDTQTAVVQADTTRIDLTVGQDRAKIDGHLVKLQAPVVVKGNRLLVPAGFLLSFYGQHVTVTSDALQDPVALALMDKSRTASSTNVDMSMKQQIDMDMAAPVNRTMSMTQEISAQVRGQDSLIHIAMHVPGQQAFATATALRAGHLFVQKPNGTWAEQVVNKSMADLVHSLNTQAGITKFLKEIHLGQAHTENGVKLQDVSFTLDPAMMQSITDQMMKSIVPPNAKLDIQLHWENVMGTVTIDTTTGAIKSQTMDAAVTVIMQMGSESMKMHMSVHQLLTLTPNTQPIVWPTDLPQP